MFHYCYILISKNPLYQNHTYIGYTTNPRRRIRQHNGLIKGGARTTHGKRPWEIFLIVKGFSDVHHAKSFEYRWKHYSLVTFKVSRKTISRGIKDRIKICLLLLKNNKFGKQKLSICSSKNNKILIQNKH